MKISFNKRFLKDLAKTSSRDRARIESFVSEELAHYQSIEEIGNMEKLQGHDTLYRARFGNYRVGVRFENNE